MFNFVSSTELPLPQEELHDLINYCESEDSDELLIFSHGNLYHRNYTNTTTPIALNSLTKVFAGVAIGLLLDEGRIDSLHTPISTFFPVWRDTPQGTITLAHILTHSSGLRTLRHDNELSSAPNITEHVLTLDLEHPPGTVSTYNNEAVALLAEIVRQVSGEALDTYLARKLFHPLGMTKWEWLKDASGNPFPYAGLSLTGTDLAKFATLFLNKGLWERKRILSEQWIEQSTYPTQQLNRNWGYLWLTSHRDDTYIGFGMSGFEGKYLFISPENHYFAIRLVHRKIGRETPGADDFFKRAIDLTIPQKIS